MKSLFRSKIGATLVEAAITIPIFLALVFFLIDLSRYFFISYILEYAAFQAADILSKDRRVKADLRDMIYNDDTTTAMRNQAAIDRSNYLALYREIDDIVLRYGRMVASSYHQATYKSGYSDDIPATTSFLKAVVFDPATHTTDYVRCPAYTSSSVHQDMLEATYNNFGDPAFKHSNVAIIRPGEIGHFYYGKNNQHKIDVPNDFRGIRRITGTWSGGDVAKTCADGWPLLTYGESWESVYQNNPIQVELRVAMRPITPFLPPIRIAVKQYAYCDLQDGGLQQPYSSQNPPAPTVPPATPTITPTPEDPGNPQPPANTATPTPTVPFTPASDCLIIGESCTSQTCCYRQLTLHGVQHPCSFWTKLCGTRNCSASAECR